MNGIKKDTAGLYHFLPAPAAQTYLIKHFMFAYQWGGRKAQEPTVSLRMAATSFSKIHFGLGLAHTPPPPNTVVGDPQLSLINTPHAQMVAQQQTKQLRNHVTFQQVLSLLPVPQGYWFFPQVGHSGRLKGWHRVTCHWHPERHTLECQPEGEEIEGITVCGKRGQIVVGACLPF